MPPIQQIFAFNSNGKTMHNKIKRAKPSFLSALLLSITLLLSAYWQTAKAAVVIPPPPTVAAAGFVLLDYETGTSIAEQNADMQLALLLLQEDVLTMGPSSSGPSSSQGGD